MIGQHWCCHLTIVDDRSHRDAQRVDARDYSIRPNHSHVIGPHFKCHRVIDRLDLRVNKARIRHRLDITPESAHYANGKSPAQGAHDLACDLKPLDQNFQILRLGK